MTSPTPKWEAKELLRSGIHQTPALQSFTWQAVGSAATLSAAFWVSWRMGLAAQGEFGLAKSWFDAVAVIAALGLPQGLMHLQYRCGVSAASLRPWLLRWLIVYATLATVLALLAHQSDLHLMALAIASTPAAVAHLLARSLILRSTGIIAFGCITALPALLLLGGVMTMSLAEQDHGFAGLLLLVAWLSGLASLTWALNAVGGTADVSEWPRRELWRSSFQNYLQAALGALLPAGLLTIVQTHSADAESVGAASIGLLAYQFCASMAGFAAPLLFDRLARDEMPSLAGRRLPWRIRIGLWLLVAVLLGTVLLSIHGSVPSGAAPLALMLLAGLSAVAARIYGTVLLARGDYAELSMQAALRLALALGITALALNALPGPTAVALALLLIEVASWLRSYQRVAAPI